ncbi:4-oxalocrotonate tautomerase family enzyme [Serratia rubidaea]|uniref:4-oxalocrotonate tautomerase family enzyme n=1 Tax=Serratia rubidaea TaxID=61652 RepID=A0A4U9HIN8_SERRU|nr:4-oxalocrotonate tautomerase family enzyme [Serratia rubidaea]
MPFVNVQTIKGILNDAQKRELLTRITDLMVEVKGAATPHFVSRCGSESTSMNLSSGAWAACSRRRP